MQTKNTVVIANAVDLGFVEKLRYSLVKAGFSITEEYSQPDTKIMVFERTPPKQDKPAVRKIEL